jgi:cell division protein FtsB
MSEETTEEPSHQSDHDPSDEPAAAVQPEAETEVVAGAGVPVAREPKPQPVRRIVWAPRTRIAVASLALVAMMFLFVFPTRSYVAQKRQIGRAAHAVEVLRAQNEVLAKQAARLKTHSEIERLAREQFNMVMPGETAYNVVETPSDGSDSTTTTVP